MVKFCQNALTAVIALLALSTYSTAQENVVASSDGVPIHFDVYGEGSPTLVLVHGWSNNRTYWEPHLPYFSQKYQVVTIDLAGFGESGLEREAWTMEAFGEDVTAVVEKLDLQEVVLVGFSMGGPVILEAATRTPQRIIGLVLVDILQDIDREYSQDEIDAIAEDYRQNLHDPAYLRNRGGAFSPDSDESLIQRFIESHPDGFPEHWWEAFDQLFHWMTDKTKPTLLEIKSPIISINSDRNPTNVEAFQRYAPSFKVKLMPGVGHNGVIWEKTDLFEQLVDESVEEFRSKND